MIMLTPWQGDEMFVGLLGVPQPNRKSTLTLALTRRHTVQFLIPAVRSVER